MPLSTRYKIALASAAYRFVSTARRLAGLGDRVKVARYGVRWSLDLSEGIDFAIYLLGRFEHETVRTYKKLLRPGATVLDIGANIGAHTLHLARCVGPQGRVIAFEPTAYAYAKLRTNIELNPDLGISIRTEQALLGEMEGAANGRIYASWPLTNTAEAKHPKHLGRLMDLVGAHGTSLDHFVSAQNISAIDLIKIDVDGNECRVLRGATQTLARFRPPIIMELMPYGLEESGSSLEELLSLLDKSGYSLYGIPNFAQLTTKADALRELIPKNGSINVLCRHNQTEKH